MPRYSVDGLVSRTDLLYMDPMKIVIEPGFNPRSENFDLDDLKPLIQLRGGLIKPLLVQNKNGVMVLRDGERRLLSILDLAQEYKNTNGTQGCLIESVPVMLDRVSKTANEALITAMLANEGSNPLTPLDEARAMLKLQTGGLSVETIATQLGKTVATVYNRLRLLEATPEVITALQAGEITTSDTLAIVKSAKTQGVKQEQVLQSKKGKIDNRAKGNNLGKGKKQLAAKAKVSTLAPVGAVALTQVSTQLTQVERQDKAIRDSIANLVDTLGLDNFLQMVIDYETFAEVFESVKRLKLLLPVFEVVLNGTEDTLSTGTTSTVSEDNVNEVYDVAGISEQNIVPAPIANDCKVSHTNDVQLNGIRAQRVKPVVA